MGVIKRGILGGFANKVANVVGSSWKGIAVIKSLPLSVANPRTAAQVAQRSLMSFAVEFAKQSLVAIKLLNDRFAQAMSGYNLFIQRNIALFTTIVPSDVSQLILSQGNLEKPETLAGVASKGAETLTITWDTVPVGNGFATDGIIIVVQMQESKEIYTSTSAIRSDGSVVISLSGNEVVGNHYAIWAGARKADGTVVSNTALFQGLVVA